MPVAHIEAGLRSFDRTMPEEHNRVLTDHLSDILLVHSEERDRQPRARGNRPRLGALRRQHDDRLAARAPSTPPASAAAWEQFGVEPGDYALVTLHRPALVDDPAMLAAVIDGHRSSLAARCRSSSRSIRARSPASRTAATTAGWPTPACALATPLGYLDFLGLEADAAFVVTDSGGVQEETTALGVRCFTLRDTTERPVTVASSARTPSSARARSGCSKSRRCSSVRSQERSSLVGMGGRQHAQRVCCTPP